MAKWPQLQSNYMANFTESGSLPEVSSSVEMSALSCWFTWSHSIESDYAADDDD